MEKAWFHSTLIMMIVVVTVMLILSAKENVKLQRENELLILKADSLHMMQLKIRKELIYSNNKIDSLHINLSYKKRRR